MAPAGGKREYITNPYAGMYGSMANVDSPYYRRFQRHHPQGMRDMPPAGGNREYITNPYAGMYGSMGNVDSPYYRQFQPSYQRGMSGG